MVHGRDASWVAACMNSTHESWPEESKSAFRNASLILLSFPFLPLGDASVSPVDSQRRVPRAWRLAAADRGGVTDVMPVSLWISDLGITDEVFDRIHPALSGDTCATGVVQKVRMG